MTKLPLYLPLVVKINSFIWEFLMLEEKKSKLFSEMVDIPKLRALRSGN